MSDTKTLILQGEGYALAIAPDAEKAKADLLAKTTGLSKVHDEDSSIIANDLLKRLSAQRNLVEKSRKQVKEPVLAVGKEIDAKAKEFLEEIQEEEARIKALQASYAEKVEAERRKAAAEAEKKRREEEKAAQEAEKAREAAAKAAEEARIAQEQADWDDSPEGKAAAAKAQEEAAKAAAEAEKAAKEAKAAEEAIVAPIAAPKGVKMELDYEILDINKLAAKQPMFVKIEPKRSMIMGYLKSLNPDDENLESTLAELGLKPVKKAVVTAR